VACNQGCLDHIFDGKACTCLVNPRALSAEPAPGPTPQPLSVAVVGAGPAGLACATALASRGHRVTVFEEREHIGGQLRLAVRVPGKQEWGYLLRYFQQQLEALHVELRLGCPAQAHALLGFDEIVLATGAQPRRPDLSGGRVWSYAEILDGAPVGPRVAILGGGGMGFAVAEFLSRSGPDASDEYFRDWGIDASGTRPGFLAAAPPEPARGERLIYLVQRKGSKMGKNLGRTTGWIHSARLQHRGVQLIGGAQIEAWDGRGLRIRIGASERVLAIDDLVACIGQAPDLRLAEDLSRLGRHPHLVGGVRDAANLSALRAIHEGMAVGGAL
jgi:2,4-dienoyl-CoA reductase (NADPH2)